MEKKEKIINGAAAVFFVLYAGFAYWALAGVEDYASFWGVVRVIIGVRMIIACGQIVVNLANHWLEKRAEL